MIIAASSMTLPVLLAARAITGLGEGLFLGVIVRVS